MVECATLEMWYPGNGIGGSNPPVSANLQFQSFRKFYAPAVRSPRLRAGRKGLILQRFATLRVAKRKRLGFGFGSSNQKGKNKDLKKVIDKKYLYKIW